VCVRYEGMAIVSRIEAITSVTMSSIKENPVIREGACGDNRVAMAGTPNVSESR
jgi:hypothetical protein